MSERRVPVLYQGSRKLVNVNFGSFESVVSSISRRLKKTNFQLSGKRSENEDYFDIEEDEDLEGLEDAEGLVLLVKDLSRVTTVKVNGEEYSIAETPGYKSKIVEDAIAGLKADIGIPSIAAQLNEVEDCLRIAYYTSIILGNKHFHKKMQSMQFDIQNLCGELDTTMLKIKLKAGDILNELQCGFGYLLDGFEDFGLERLGAVDPIAAEIHKEAASLMTLVKSQQEAVKKNLTQVEYSDEDAIRLAAIKAEIAREVSQSEKKFENLALGEKKSIQAARQHRESDSGIGFGFMKVITFGFYEGNKSRAEQEERFAREMREEQARERERLAGLKEEEARANIELNAAKAWMKGTTEEMSDAAIQGAKTVLETLTSSMACLAQFWEKTGAQFKRFNDTAFISELKSLSDPKWRMNIWTNNDFKIQAMRYIARFVAIQSMCKDFQKTMTKVLDDTHECIRDNPTPAEANEKLPKLVKQFKDRTDANTGL